MMPDRIGISGNTHGVNARPSPARKNTPNTSQIEPFNARLNWLSVDSPLDGATVVIASRFPGGQRHRHGARHLRIADVVFETALECRGDRDILRVGFRARQRNRNLDLIVVNGRRAEVGVGVLLALRPFRRAERHARRVGGEVRLVAIQVIVFRHREAREHFAGAGRDRLERERLLLRQRTAVDQRIRRRAAAKRNRQAHRRMPHLPLLVNLYSDSLSAAESRFSVRPDDNPDSAAPARLSTHPPAR